MLQIGGWINQLKNMNMYSSLYEGDRNLANVQISGIINDIIQREIKPRQRSRHGNK